MGRRRNEPCIQPVTVREQKKIRLFKLFNLDLIYFYFYFFSSRDNANIGESSKTAPPDVDDTDNPFLVTGTENAMPDPSPKSKKIFLEDYENFTVK